MPWGVLHPGEVKFRGGSEWKSAKFGFICGDPSVDRRKGGDFFFLAALLPFTLGRVVEAAGGGRRRRNTSSSSSKSFHPSSGASSSQLELVSQPVIGGVQQEFHMR